MVLLWSTSAVGPRRDWSGSRSLASLRVAEAGVAAGARQRAHQVRRTLPPGACGRRARGERDEGDGGGGDGGADVSRCTGRAVT